MTRIQFTKFARKKRKAINRRKRQILRLESEIAHAEKHVKETKR